MHSLANQWKHKICDRKKIDVSEKRMQETKNTNNNNNNNQNNKMKTYLQSVLIVRGSHVKYRFYMPLLSVCAFKPLRDVLLIVNLLFLSFILLFVSRLLMIVYIYIHTYTYMYIKTVHCTISQSIVLFIPVNNNIYLLNA